MSLQTLNYVATRATTSEMVRQAFIKACPTLARIGVTDGWTGGTNYTDAAGVTRSRGRGIAIVSWDGYEMLEARGGTKAMVNVWLGRIEDAASQFGKALEFYLISQQPDRAYDAAFEDATQTHLGIAIQGVEPATCRIHDDCRDSLAIGKECAAIRNRLRFRSLRPVPHITVDDGMAAIRMNTADQVMLRLRFFGNTCET